MSLLSSTWDRTYTERREKIYSAEDARLSHTENDAYASTALEGADPITAYFKIETIPALDPPQYLYRNLEGFLRRADQKELEAKDSHTAPRVIVDDRRDDTAASNPTRNWSHEFWQRTPPRGADVWYKLTNASGLHDRLKKHVCKCQEHSNKADYQ